MGEYSSNIPKAKARTLVENKNHLAFNKKKNKFWLAYGDNYTLHYGERYLEGTIDLNKKGKEYYKEYFKYLDNEQD